MREIKFRAWDTNHNVFIADMERHYYDNGLSDYHGRYVLQQYTGLNNKNGKEIYEGDVIEFTSGGNILRRVVLFKNCSFILGKSKNSPYKKSRLLNSAFVFQKGAKVIGNIYENPELLK